MTIGFGAPSGPSWGARLTIPPPAFIRTAPEADGRRPRTVGPGPRRRSDPWRLRIGSAGFSRWPRGRDAGAWGHPVIGQTRSVEMFNQVVWATDGSAQADRALEYAKQLVQGGDGTLHVVHIVEKLVGARVSGQDANVNERETEAKIKAQARAAERKGLNVKVHIGVGHGGEIARRIADEAADAQADVIVVGTRGYSPVGARVFCG